MRRRAWGTLLAGAAALAVVTGVSIVWPGLDARETPPVDASLWVLQTGDGQRYARVNTEIGELDTVRQVGNPSALAQSGSDVYLFSESFGKLTRVDEALPVDIDEETLKASDSTPPGTTEVRVAGDYVAYLTDAGAVYAGRLTAGAPPQVDPGDEGDERDYAADAIAVSAQGVLYTYSRTRAEVQRYDIDRADVLGRDPLQLTDPGDEIIITGAGNRWGVLDVTAGEMWRDGAEAPLSVELLGTPLAAQADADADQFYLADEAGLLAVPFEGDALQRLHGVQGAAVGAPARPVWWDGVLYASWLPSSGEGVLWSSAGTVLPLEYGGADLPEQRRPAFVTGSGAVALNEMRSGWVWTVPDGALVPSSQDWELQDPSDPDAQQSTEEAPVVLEPKPPVAEADQFGVRAGTLSALDVLLNDHDPNEDVLSIDASSVTGLDPAFGTVTVVDGGQRLAVQTAPGAVGSATVSYRVTDGTAADGLYSEPTSVLLSVGEGNAAPQWCGVPGCLADWPEPEVAIGGTVSVPVLPGWVDPDGDPLLVLGVQNRSGVGSAVVTPAGQVVYRHRDDGMAGERTVPLEVTVGDTAGATTTRTLSVRVAPDPGLHVQSFTVVDVLSEGLSVDVAPHVTGTAGRISLTGVRVLDDAPATAVVAAGGTSFDFTAREPGEFRVGFTVTDGAQSREGTARITVLPPDAPAHLATAPVTVFLHPKEDVTVDVFAAVDNPTRRVLLLSDVVATPAAGASMTVDAVGHDLLRVSGSTASGEAGALGTIRYTVSDGTSDASSRVQGEATVFLLPPAPEVAPIAVDDRIVVRVGAQVDIPALGNDVAAAGGTVSLDPDQVLSSTDDALAFASGDVIRYLAPSRPGQYTIDYSVSAAGAPSLADSALVHVTVTPDDANRAPLPETLEGRVLSSETTTIPFDGFGADPDGDTVFLDRILDQPDRGAAAISADGTSIVYSSVPGDSGQRSFRYRVVDAFGVAGIGTARVGVLDAEANPSPVTFTDYVQVQVGQEHTTRVRPLANDVDPTGESLELVAVRPDVAETLGDGSPSPEYARMLDRLIETDQDEVVIAAGTTPGTMGFLYDVRSASGNTARGLIVVRVVREAVPDHPVVADTVLTTETRDGFTRGVDVLAGKVSWSGGEVDDLTLGLWGRTEGVEVVGDRLRGELGATTRIIPFSVSGTGVDGPVRTYGFLRIPGEDELTLALKRSAGVQEVTEDESVEFDMADLVGLPRGERLEVGAELSAAGARSAAECVVAEGTRVRYTAGRGAPWSDACHVPVRLVGGTEWTFLSVPIRVRPVEPQPSLLAGSLTVGPGESTTFDLRSLTRWEGREGTDPVDYAVAYSGTRFTVTETDGVLTITGADTAVPGVEEVVRLSIENYGATAASRLILRVGSAPRALPIGGTVTQTCSQAEGSSCVITVAGAAGQVNPLPSTPLALQSVAAAGSCPGVQFAVETTTQVRASWTGDAPGETCRALFTMTDAQGRSTAGDRAGTLVLDLHGYPRGPAGVVQASYSDGSLTLRVDPGEARAAYPALSGFTVRWGEDVVATCTAAGVCPAIAAPNGEEREYVVTAVNPVGESPASARTAAWAYDTPASPTVAAVEPVVTRGDGGLVSLRIEDIDHAETGSLEIVSAVGESLQVPVAKGHTEVSVPSFRVGSNTSTPIVITPRSRYPIPAGLAGATSGAAVTVHGHGVGAPREPALALQAEPDGADTVTVRALASAAIGGDGAVVRYGVAREGATCTPTATSPRAAFSALPAGEEYAFTMCAESLYEGTAFGRSTARATVRAVQSTAAPEGFTFVVDAAPALSGARADWVIRDAPSSAQRVPNNNVPQWRGGPPTSVFDRDPGLSVRYVHEQWGTATDWAAITPRAGSAPYQVWARWSVASCIGGSALETAGTSSKAPSGAGAGFRFGVGDVVYYDAAGAVVPHVAGSRDVPVGAVRVEGISVRADWRAQGWGLAPAEAVFGGTCDPNLPPEPPPEPQPEPEPEQPADETGTTNP